MLESTQKQLQQNMAVTRLSQLLIICTHTHTRLTALCMGQVSRYQKGKTNLDFTEARDSEWQWHQLGYMQVCT